MYRLWTLYEQNVSGLCLTCRRAHPPAHGRFHIYSQKNQPLLGFLDMSHALHPYFKLVLNRVRRGLPVGMPALALLLRGSGCVAWPPFCGYPLPFYRPFDAHSHTAAHA